MEQRWKRIIECCYPSRCPGCDRILEPEELRWGFCRDCAKEVVTVREHFCMKCGKLLAEGSSEYCSDCRKRKHFFREGRGVFLYRGPMKSAMYRFKYANRRGYAGIFAKKADLACGEWIRSRGADLIVPVPLYWKKLRQRGYNQAFVWAKALGEEWGIVTEGHALIRLRPTRPQKELNPAERSGNLRNAFYAKREWVQGRKILLTDDIYTTGSTMDAAAEALIEAGAGEILALSVCTGADEEILRV